MGQQLKSFGKKLIERNFYFKKRWETFNVRNFYPIKSGNINRVNSVLTTLLSKGF